MIPFLALVKRELRAVARERTIMIAILIQLFIASFSSTILMGLISFYDPSAIIENIDLKVRVGILGDLDSLLVSELRARGIRPVFITYPDDAERAFQSGSVDALIFVPGATAGPLNITLFLPTNEARATVISMALREPLKRFENDLRAGEGVVVNFADLAGSNPTTYEFLYATIVPLLLFFPGFVAGSMVVDSITSEFEHQTLEMLQAAPLSMNQIIGSKIAAAVVLALAQVVLWLFLLRFNGVELSHAGPVLLLGMTVAGLNGVGAGLIATIFKDRERAQLMYSMAILVAVSASYMTGRSPLTLLVQLASGDYYAGWSDVALYLVLLLGLVGALFASTPRLMRLKF